MLLHRECDAALIGDGLLHAINTQKMRVVLPGKFIFGKHIVDMLSDSFFIPSEKGTVPYSWS